MQSAYPVVLKGPEGHQCGETGQYWQYPGLSMRDYLAAKAMQGILAAWDDRKCEFAPMPTAARAYAVADAMIAEREKRCELSATQKA